MTEEKVLLAHGDGGQLMADLVSRVFQAEFGEPLEGLDGQTLGDDCAVFYYGARFAFTTDSFVVSPLFFPGGDIGRLAVFGTVNDLATAGAMPVCLSASFILEEGLAMDIVRKVAASMAEACREANVPILTGDTKVVPRGQADQMFVTTTGVGAFLLPWPVTGDGARPGDIILINGPIGDHGFAILSKREGMKLESDIVSDCAHLDDLVRTAFKASRKIHAMRDPTRGGLATSLCDLAAQSKVCIEVDEDKIPVRESVRAGCELLGLDPLYLANEGKMIMIVDPEQADKILNALKGHALGQESAVIGRVLDGPAGRAQVKSSAGTHRILQKYAGEPLPRIC
jgi:hydrogenase expression/formation protein HypE